MTELQRTPERVLLVDDHEAARDWLRRSVSAAFPGVQADQVGDARGAFDLLGRQRYDLALLDLGLPDASGLEVLRVLRQRQTQCVSIVATVFDDDEHLFTALRLGADGYLLKDQAQDSLADALRGILAGQPALSAGIARRLIGHFARPVADAPPSVPGPPAAPLTGRERDVLQLVSKGCSVPETARLLGISAHTAHGYVKDVYRKLSVSSRAEAAIAANRLGLA